MSGDGKEPWRCDLWQRRTGWKLMGHKRKKTAAMNLIDRPFKSGVGHVQNINSGESWKRVRGSWFREVKPQPKASSI